jgi:hypothetical protein
MILFFIISHESFSDKFNRPHLGYPMPHLGYPIPHLGYPIPHLGYPVPHLGYPGAEGNQAVIRGPHLGYPTILSVRRCPISGPEQPRTTENM